MRFVNVDCLTITHNNVAKILSHILPEYLFVNHSLILFLKIIFCGASFVVLSDILRVSQI